MKIELKEGIFISKRVEDKPFELTTLVVLPKGFKTFEEYEQSVIKRLKLEMVVQDPFWETNGMLNNYEIKVNPPTVEIKVYTNG